MKKRQCPCDNNNIQDAQIFAKGIQEQVQMDLVESFKSM
jgi:hypothetical protein